MYLKVTQFITYKYYLQNFAILNKVLNLYL